MLNIIITLPIKRIIKIVKKYVHIPEYSAKHTGT